MNIDNLKDGLLMKAIEELNNELKNQDIPVITLNVVGGFALMLQDVRKDIYAVTDIDYIGDDLPNIVENISDKIGMKYGLGQHWINNDVLLSGATLEDIEFSTGKLHFNEAFVLDKIHVNVLDKRDLLRMKVIAIDTSLSAVDFGGEFTRMKDFEDIRKLMNTLDLSMEEVMEECNDYIMSPSTFTIIEEYMMDGLDGVNAYLKEKPADLDFMQNEDDLMSLYEALKTEYRDRL